jgi:hypothetical protein
MIRIDEAWLAVDPLDMRAGFDTVLARVVAVFDGKRELTRTTADYWMIGARSG